MRKRGTILILFILVLSFVLAGCGGEEPAAGQITPNTTGAAVVETTAPLEEAPASLGRLEGGTYTNTYAGYGCELDSSWVYYGAEELQELPENIQEQLAGSELGDSMEGISQITDMKAENATDLTTINVLYTKLGLEERLAYAVLSEEDIADTILSQQEALTEAYSQMGIEVLSMEKREVTFLGQPRIAVWTETNAQGIPYYILQLADYSRGQYGVTLTLASYVEDNTESLLDLFYAVS